MYAAPVYPLAQNTIMYHTPSSGPCTSWPPDALYPPLKHCFLQPGRLGYSFCAAPCGAGETCTCGTCGSFTPCSTPRQTLPSQHTAPSLPCASGGRHTPTACLLNTFALTTAPATLPSKHTPSRCVDSCVQAAHRRDQAAGGAMALCAARAPVNRCSRSGQRAHTCTPMMQLPQMTWLVAGLLAPER